MTLATSLDVVQSSGHSSVVTLTLIVEGGRHELTDVGPTDATLRHATIIPEADGTVEIVVDGRKHCRAVKLMGTSTASDRLRFA